MANSNQWKEMRKSALKTIDTTNFIELVLKQMNYQRMNGVDLIDDLDKLVNWYLWICKKYPEPKEDKVKPAPTKEKAKKVVDDTLPSGEAEISKDKTDVDDTLSSADKSSAPKKSKPKAKKTAQEKKDK